MERDEEITAQAVNHVGVVFHDPIISYHTPHASTIPDFFIVLTPYRIASYGASPRPLWAFLIVVSGESNQRQSDHAPTNNCANHAYWSSSATYPPA